MDRRQFVTTSVALGAALILPLAVEAAAIVEPAPVPKPGLVLTSLTDGRTISFHASSFMIDHTAGQPHQIEIILGDKLSPDMHHRLMNTLWDERFAISDRITGTPYFSNAAIVEMILLPPMDIRRIKLKTA